MVKDNLALDAPRLRFEYAKIDMMEDLANNAIELQMRNQQKRYAKKYMMERIVGANVIGAADGVSSTLLNPQQENTLNILDKDLPVRYSTGTIFKKEDFSIPLIPVNKKHTTVDKRMLLYC